MATRVGRLRASGFTGGVAAWRPQQMYAWPGLTQVKGNELLAVASERKHHVCPFGRIVVVRSTDGGKHWHLPQEVFNSEMDDRHPSVVTMPDGTLVCAWITVNFWMNPRQTRPEWAARAARVTDRLLEEVLGDWLVTSSDGGHTWEQVPHRMPHGGALHVSPHPLSDGSLGCFGYEMASDGLHMFFYRSSDKGKSWLRLGEVPCQERVTGSFAWVPWQLSRGKEVSAPPLSMRTLLELGPQHFLVMFGTNGGYLAQTESTDGGETWSQVKDLPIQGFPPHLLRLSNGAILCTYALRQEPFSIRAVLSYDEGKSWDADHVITIDHWQDKPDMGYPVSAEPEPGQVVTVYYCHREPPAGGPPGSQEGNGLLFKRFRLR